MYAQVIEGGTTPDHRTEMDAIVTDDLIPALESEPGYAGALNLVDRDSGQALMIVLWDEEAQARRPLPDYGSGSSRPWPRSRRSRPGSASRSASGR
jgi:hypothetical protein